MSDLKLISISKSPTLSSETMVELTDKYGVTPEIKSIVYQGRTLMIAKNPQVTVSIKAQAVQLKDKEKERETGIEKEKENQKTYQPQKNSSQQIAQSKQQQQLQTLTTVLKQASPEAILNLVQLTGLAINSSVNDLIDNLCIYQASATNQFDICIYKNLINKLTNNPQNHIATFSTISMVLHKNPDILKNSLLARPNIPHESIINAFGNILNQDSSKYAAKTLCNEICEILKNEKITDPKTAIGELEITISSFIGRDNTNTIIRKACIHLISAIKENRRIDTVELLNAARLMAEKL